MAISINLKGCILVLWLAVGFAASRASPPEVVDLKVKLVDFVGLSIPKQEGQFILDFVQTWEDRNGQVNESHDDVDEDDLDSFHPSSNKLEDVDRRFSFIENGTEMGVWTPKESIGVQKFRNFQIQSERIKLKRRSGVTELTQRVKVDVACEMYIGLFPFDTHLCSLQFSSSGGGNFSARPQICGSFHSYEFYLKGYSSVIIPSSTHHKNKQLSLYLIISRTSTMQIFGQMYSPLIMLLILSFFTLTIGTYSFRIASSIAFFLCLILITSIFWRDIPRAYEGSNQTAIEHYFVLSIGLAFQIVLTNILMYGYLSKKPSLVPKGKEEEDDDMEANKVNGSPSTLKNNSVEEDSESPPNFEVGEEHILKMGGFHRVVYFKILKPTKNHLPIAFLIFNVIYWPIVLFLSSGLPQGFVAPSALEKCV